MNGWLYVWCHQTAENACIPSPQHLNFQKIVWKFALYTFPNFLNKEHGYNYSLQNEHVKLNPGLPRQKQRSTRRRLSPSAN
jgi:hypothetical protein